MLGFQLSAALLVTDIQLGSVSPGRQLLTGDSGMVSLLGAERQKERGGAEL